MEEEEEEEEEVVGFFKTLVVSVPNSSLVSSKLQSGDSKK